jgi:prepilin peptidase CpaA
MFQELIGLTMLHTLSISTLPILLIIAAAGDVVSLRIPNWLTIVTALLFFPMAFLTGMPLMEFGTHILAGIILFGVGFIFFQFGLFGGGDAKLMAAAGLWFGTTQTLPFLFATVLAGGALAFVVGIWSMLLLSWEIHGNEEGFGDFGKKIREMKPNVPYGLAFAIGGILAFRETWWVTGIA